MLRGVAAGAALTGAGEPGEVGDIEIDDGVALCARVRSGSPALAEPPARAMNSKSAAATLTAAPYHSAFGLVRAPSASGQTLESGTGFSQRCASRSEMPAVNVAVSG
jgi:hypothetical protein